MRIVEQSVTSANATSRDLLAVQVPRNWFFLLNPSPDGMTKQALRRWPIMIELGK
jgi:hypothetical protein